VEYCGKGDEEVAESMPTTPEQLRQLNRSLMEKVLDRAGRDPGWKQQLLDDPGKAMQEAGFPEAEMLRETYEGAMAETEVAGQQSSGCIGCVMASLSMVTGY
jgi:hypothetical protein